MGAGIGAGMTGWEVKKMVLTTVQGGASMPHAEEMVSAVLKFKVHGEAQCATGEGDLKRVCDHGWAVSSTL